MIVLSAFVFTSTHLNHKSVLMKIMTSLIFTCLTIILGPSGMTSLYSGKQLR